MRQIPATGTKFRDRQFPGIGTELRDRQLPAIKTEFRDRQAAVIGNAPGQAGKKRIAGDENGDERS